MNFPKSHGEKTIDFAIAGVQKAGTTALAQYLDQHDDLYLPPTKELHIFRHSPTTQKQLASDVRDKYQEAPQNLLWGEATPLYMYWPQSLESMALHNPAMKIIVSLRHPVLRAYSGWSMERRRERETESFSYAIRKGRERVSMAPGRVHLRYSYVERGFYSAQVRRLLSVFPRKNVFFLRSDSISARSTDLQNLLGFLGVAGMEFNPIETNIFPSSLEHEPQSLQGDFAYLQSVFQEDIGHLSALTGLDVTDWLACPQSTQTRKW